jgi:hypothetical protein
MLKALQALGLIVAFLRDIFDFIRELRRKEQIDQADEQHTANTVRIDEAFAQTLREPQSPALPAPPGLQDPAAGQPRREAFGPPPVPGGPGARP